MPNELSRRLFLSGLSAGAVAGLSACGQEEIERVVPAETATASTSDAVAPGSDPRKWVHIGDSFTASGTTVTELANLTGYTHSNSGISGDNSLKAAARSGLVNLTGSIENSTINKESRSLITSMDPIVITANTGRKYPVAISGISGYLVNEVGEESTFFVPEPALQEDIIVDSLIDILPDPDASVEYMRKHIVEKNSMIIGLGRNDIDLNNSVDTLVDNINLFIDSNDSADKRYLIWEIPPWVQEPYGSSGREKLDSWNAVLAQEFTDYFVSPIQWLIRNPETAFQEANVPLSDRDKANIENGVIPHSLRRDDVGHFNVAGAKFWAYFMFQELKKRGW